MIHKPRHSKFKSHLLHLSDFRQVYSITESLFSLIQYEDNSISDIVVITSEGRRTHVSAAFKAVSGRGLDKEFEILLQGREVEGESTLPAEDSILKSEFL